MSKGHRITPPDSNRPPRRWLIWVWATFSLTAAGCAAAGIVEENALPGTTDWLIQPDDMVTETPWGECRSGARPCGVSLSEVEGYASKLSVVAGERLSLYVNSREPSYTMRVFRVGWYGNRGGREVMGPLVMPGVEQPACDVHPQTLRVACDWHESYELTIPNSWISGVYLIKLTAGESGKQSYIFFVVREETPSSSLLFQTSVTTYNAYNRWGGYNLYTNPLAMRAVEVSFNRPMGILGAGQFLTWEINMVRWLEREGYDVSYITNLDTHARPFLLRGRDGFLSVGHDEYWTFEMRRHIEEALAEDCLNLGFFSANSVYWQIRLEPDESGNPMRTMVAYKENAMDSGARIQDPLWNDGNPGNDRLITAKWREARWEPGLGVLPGRPEDALIGVMYAFYPVGTDMVVENTWHWIFSGTGLDDGDRLPGLVGYEADRQYGHAPPGIVQLASSPVPTVDSGFFDCSSDLDSCRSNMTIYQAPSLAWVFATGTFRWGYALDSFNQYRLPGARGVPVRDSARTLTRNLLSGFRREGSACQPTIAPFRPSPAVDDVVATLERVTVPGFLEITECLVEPLCGLHRSLVSPGNSTVVIPDREDLNTFVPGQINRPIPGSPDPKLFDWVGTRYRIDTDTQRAGGLRLLVGYGELGVPQGRERHLQLLYLPRGAQEWKSVTAAASPEFDVLLATAQEPGDFALIVEQAQAVTVDVLPESINVDAKGRIPVAVLSSPSFDAATVQPESVRFGTSGVEAMPVKYVLGDINGDGAPDQLFFFSTPETGLSCLDRAGWITGSTKSGKFFGSDGFKVPGCR